MNYILKKLKQQQEAVEGKPMELDGEIIKIGELTEEEKKQMIEEGYELGNTIVEIDGVPTKLLDVKNGSTLFTITEVKNFEGNYTGMWYIWRSRRIMEAFNKLSEKAQEQLKTILAKKGLDIYLEDL